MRFSSTSGGGEDVSDRMTGESEDDEGGDGRLIGQERDQIGEGRRVAIDCRRETKATKSEGKARRLGCVGHQAYLWLYSHDGQLI